MKRKIKFVIVCVSLVILLGLTILLVASKQPGINRLNAERITIGMTEAEVEALLGGKAGDYGPPTESPFERTRRIFFLTKTTFKGEKQWLDDKGMVCVSFDANGFVSGKRFTPYGDNFESFFERIRFKIFQLFSI